MPFTPEEIESKEFLVVLRGYDKEEVGSFLRAVAADVRALQEEGGAPAAVAPEPAAPVYEEPTPAAAPEPVAAPSGDPFSTMGTEMASVLRAASDAAAAIRQKADDEAAERVRVASEEAAGVRKAADDEAEAILASARATRSDASDEAARLREQAAQEAADTRDNAAREAERLVEAALARRDRLTNEALELQRRLTTAEETLQTLLRIVTESQLGPEPVEGNGSIDNNGGSEGEHHEGEHHEGDEAYVNMSSEDSGGEWRSE